MSPKIPPPAPPPRESRNTIPPLLRRILAIWPVLAGLAGGAVATFAWIEGFFDARIRAILIEHEADAAAHPDLRRSLAELQTWKAAHEPEHRQLAIALAEVRPRLSQSESDLFELYWFAVGDKAAEATSNHALRALAARETRERFRIFVRDGEGLKDAYRHALESPPPR